MHTETPGEKTSLKLLNNQIPYIEIPGKGPKLSFLHANGYPPRVYQQLLDQLSNSFHIIAMQQRPMWKNSVPSSIKSWTQLADDYIPFLENTQSEKVIGVGHSFGAAVTAHTAVKRPDLFHKIILIDPVILPYSYLWWQKFMPISIRAKMIPLAKIARNRKSHWESRAALFEAYRGKRIFRHMPDEALQNFAKYGLQPVQDGGFQLSYSKEWEERIYLTVSNVLKACSQLKIPFLCIRGERSDAFLAEPWEQLKLKRPDGHYIEIKDAGHLFPLEIPYEVAQQITSFIG